MSSEKAILSRMESENRNDIVRRLVYTSFFLNDLKTDLIDTSQKYIITNWNSTHYIKFDEDKEEWVIYETLGEEVEIGKEYIMIKPKF